MHLGDIEIRYLDGGNFWLDGGAMFGVVPKVFWEKKSPPDEKNRIRLRANSLLVRAHGKTIVIETGNGTKWDPKQRAIYAVQDGDPLVDSLAANGARRGDIDLVINTHLHFDHAGGNTRIENGRAVPTFPHARYVVQRAELEHGNTPTERDRASYFPENCRPITDAGLWDLVDGDTQILPGISVARIPGHNADIQAVILTGGRKTLAFVADLLPTRHHIPLPWIMAYDLYPLQTLETKRKWLPRMAKENWTVVFGHDPDVAAATLLERDGKIDFEPVDLNR
ncbi:MAG TPA: MBL fold metallo-hydrolase [Candidatus Sulfotelmatobacter sp.]|jgi:glyoxylase-like metal-dependent hydrolase (beta-lactamase superfamily II)|nr:MBL fold metallo-hydrolase [Candidatus Sulfotelmatobacter sp.]